jgi:long-subunit fatty acid transport protein
MMHDARAKGVRRGTGVLFVLSFTLASSLCGLDNVATTSAQFLKIDVGARASAMGGNFVALADDPSALYWNPAGIALLEGPSFTASHIEWLLDITHDFAGFAIPVADGAIGVSVIALNTGRWEQTTIEKPEGTGIFVDFSGISIGFTYARQMTDRFSFGLTGKYIAEKAFNESAQTAALDLGTLLDTGYKSIRIGMCITNFGGRMKLSGRDLLTGVDTNSDGTPDTDAALTTDSWALPLRFRVGMSMNLVGISGAIAENDDHRMTITVDGLHPNDNVESLGLGLEYTWSETASLRVGYKSNHDTEDLTFGGGIKLTIMDVDLGIDYSFSDMGDLEDVQRASITLLF